jgi:hypothetical protein
MISRPDGALFKFLSKFLQIGRRQSELYKGAFLTKLQIQTLIKASFSIDRRRKSSMELQSRRLV